MKTIELARQDGVRIAALVARAAKETLKPRCILCDRPRSTRRGLCRSHNQWVAYWGLAPLFPAARGAKRGPKPTFDWAACGTPAQCRKHYRQGVPMCEACRRAENRRRQDSKKKLSKVPRNSGKRMIS